MAATMVFTGATSGSLAVATNYQPNQVPIAGDNFILNETTQTAPSTAMTTFQGVRLGEVTVGKNYPFAVGSSSNPMVLGCAKLTVQSQRGTFHWKPDRLVADTTEVIVNCGRSSDPNMAMYGTAGFVSGGIARFVLTSGIVDASDYDATIADLITSFRTSQAGDAQLDFATNQTTSANNPKVTALTQKGGTLTLAVVPDSILMVGPCNLHITKDSFAPSIDLHSITIRGGAELVYEADPLFSHANDTLLFGGNAQDGETATVDGKVYTFQTTLTDVDGNVQIGGSLALSAANLVAASTLVGTPGTDYAVSMTSHPTAYFIVLGSSGITAFARKAGTAGNSIVTATTLAAGGWNGSGFFTGGKQIGTLEIQDGLADFSTIANEVFVTTVRQWPGGILKKQDHLFNATTTEDMTGGDVD